MADVNAQWVLRSDFFFEVDARARFQCGPDVAAVTAQDVARAMFAAHPDQAREAAASTAVELMRALPDLAAYVVPLEPGGFVYVSYATDAPWKDWTRVLPRNRNLWVRDFCCDATRVRFDNDAACDRINASVLRVCTRLAVCADLATMRVPIEDRWVVFEAGAYLARHQQRLHANRTGVVAAAAADADDGRLLIWGIASDYARGSVNAVVAALGPTADLPPPFAFLAPSRVRCFPTHQAHRDAVCTWLLPVARNAAVDALRAARANGVGRSSVAFQRVVTAHVCARVKSPGDARAALEAYVLFADVRGTERDQLAGRREYLLLRVSMLRGRYTCAPKLAALHARLVELGSALDAALCEEARVLAMRADVMAHGDAGALRTRAFKEAASAHMREVTTMSDMRDARYFKVHLHLRVLAQVLLGCAIELDLNPQPNTPQHVFAFAYVKSALVDLLENCADQNAPGSVQPSLVAVEVFAAMAWMHARNFDVEAALAESYISLAEEVERELDVPRWRTMFTRHVRVECLLRASGGVPSPRTLAIKASMQSDSDLYDPAEDAETETDD